MRKYLEKFIKENMGEMADLSIDEIFNDDFYYETDDSKALSLREIEVKRKHNYLKRNTSRGTIGDS
jgi:hypothetical protein